MKKNKQKKLAEEAEKQSAEPVWSRGGLVVAFVLAALFALVLAVTLYLPRS